MAGGFQKEYGVGGEFVPAFDVTPRKGLAALDVTFIDQQFLNDDAIQKEYFADAGETPVQKEYV